jgi:hypothetical protein
MIGMARVGARMSPKQRLAVRQIDSAPLLASHPPSADIDARDYTASVRCSISPIIARPRLSRACGVGACWH